MASLNNLVPPGVVTGDDLLTLLEHARSNGYAIPAVNCTSSSTINACLEAAQKANSPVIIRCSSGGGTFYGGKNGGNGSPDAATIGAVALAMHTRSVAKYYGIPVVLHTCRCNKKLLPSWFEGMLAADEDFYAKYGEPLFSSHNLGLAEEPDGDNIDTCVQYFKRMAQMKIWLEMEIGRNTIGGEEEEDDGVKNNEDVVDPEKLYASSTQVYRVYEALSKIGDMFSIAAVFGVYNNKPGNNAVLLPERLGKHQEYVRKKINATIPKPVFLVVYGGSGLTEDEIRSAVSHGVVKMNIDTDDTQWAYWDGLRKFEKENRDYLQCRIGNPSGPTKPNKKHYDSRVWIRKAEESMIECVVINMEKLGSKGKYTPSYKEPAHPQIPIPKPTFHPIVLMAGAAMVGSAATMLIRSFSKR